MNMFEEATRKKYRWTSNKGEITIEQLWDLPLQSEGNHVSLDKLAIELNKQIETTATESFVDEQPKQNKTLVTKLNILKHIIKVKKDDNARLLQSYEKRRHKEKIQDIINRKKDAELELMSLSDLQKQLDEL